MRHKHLDCCRQLTSSHFQSYRDKPEQVLAQRRAKLRSEIQGDSCVRENYINNSTCTWEKTNRGRVWRDVMQFHEVIEY